MFLQNNEQVDPESKFFSSLRISPTWDLLVLTNYFSVMKYVSQHNSHVSHFYGPSFSWKK